MASNGKTVEHVKLLYRGAGKLDDKNLDSTLKKMKRIQTVLDAPALPFKEVSSKTGREPVKIPIPDKPSSLSLAKASAAINTGRDRAKVSTPKKTLSPQPLQDETLINKYDTRPRYSGRKWPSRKPSA
jgi:hypothetical protein